MEYKSFERDRLRKLAEEWMTIASSADMAEKRIAWRNVKSLKPGRPVLHIETSCIKGFIPNNEILCENEYLRNTERMMVQLIRHCREVGDDLILEPYLRLAWKIDDSGFGFELDKHNAKDSMSYTYSGQIDSPDDIVKLKPRVFSCNRQPTLELRDTLDRIFGDILPIRLGNVELLTGDQIGFNPLVGPLNVGITNEALQIIGQENLLLWPYDAPDELKELVDYVRKDRISYCKWLEQEGLLDYNADGYAMGPSSLGYCDELPAYGDSPAKLSDCWGWAESQESISISPEMFAEFYLPALADAASLFGMVYYGCCEPVEDRIDLILKAIPKIRAISISAWCNYNKAVEVIGDGYVLSRKLNAAYLSGKEPQWNNIENDLVNTAKAFRGRPVEYIVNDVYDTNQDFTRLKKFSMMFKKAYGI